MESQIKSSFIPEDTVAPKRKHGVVMSSGGDLLLLLGTIALVASGALAGAAFLYHRYVENDISVKQQSIQRAQDAIEPALIQELSRLDARMQSADTLLDSHISTAAVFSILEEVTLQSISFTDFSLITDAPGSIKLTLRGMARSVNAIALQSDLFGKSGVITNAIFSDINRNAEGFTQFRVDATLNTAALGYRTLLTAAANGQSLLRSEQQMAETTVQQEQATTTEGGTGQPSGGGLPQSGGQQ